MKKTKLNQLFLMLSVAPMAMYADVKEIAAKGFDFVNLGKNLAFAAFFFIGILLIGHAVMELYKNKQQDGGDKVKEVIKLCSGIALLSLPVIVKIFGSETTDGSAMKDTDLKLN